MTVYTLLITHERYGDYQPGVFATREDAVRSLATYCREQWDDTFDSREDDEMPEGRPEELPDKTVIDRYFSFAFDEDWQIDEHTLTCPHCGA